MIKGLAPKHSYNVLDYKVIGQKEIHLKIRDPRGGNYSAFPNSFSDLTEEEAFNGIFWVNHAGLLANFEVITISRVKYGSNYYYKTFTAKELTDNQGCLLMKVKDKTQVSVTVHQKHKKFFDEKFKYSMVRGLLA